VRTTKISIAIDKQLLRLARAAAKAERLSLSAFITYAVRKQFEELRRVNAARDLYATWDDSSLPTPADRDTFLARMSRPQRRRARAA